MRDLKKDLTDQETRTEEAERRVKQLEHERDQMERECHVYTCVYLASVVEPSLTRNCLSLSFSPYF